MKLHLFSLKEHYPIVTSWWSGRQLPSIPVCILPDNGIIVEGGDTSFLAAGWMYLEETGRLAVIDWITTNPEANTLMARGAVQMILDFFSKSAKERGCPNIMSFVAKDTGLHRLMVKDGWTDQQSEPHVMLFKTV